MKKFLLRRVGMADDWSGARPSLPDCLEAVLQQADVLMLDVLDGLAALTSQPQSKRAFGGRLPLSNTVTDLLCSQAVALKKTFLVQLRLGVYNGGAQDFAEQPLVRFEDLQLLDSAQIDASIEFAMAQHEVMRSVDDVLPTLNALISNLLGWITVQPQLNPLKPEVFVRALQACLAQFSPDEQARTALITPAAGLLGVGLRQLYREVCDWLLSQGVEPAMPVGVPLGGAGALSSHSPINSVARTIVTLDKLRKLLSGELGRSGGFGSALSDFSHTVPASFVALEDLKLIEPMMKRLAQRASLAAQAATEVDAAAGITAPEPVQGRQLGAQLGEEVVRMMLDNLMKDERMLANVRALIKTLEPTLLTLAQSDPRFFSERQHPARQFLDRLTNRSLGYTSDGDAGFARFLQPLSSAVEHLTRGPADAGVFAQVLRELEAGWVTEDSAQRLQHQEAARALLHAEQRNLLAQRLGEDFQERLRNREIAEVVASFLRGPWAQVVAQSQLSCADGRADPGGYLALVEDLLWSVDLRLARRNRPRLVHMVPELLVRLRQGMQLIQYPQERIAVFFDALITLHEKVFEGHRAQPSAPTDRQTSEPSSTVGDELDQPDALEGLDSAFWVADDEARESGYLPQDAEPASAVVQSPWSVADLNIGVWVELLVDGVWLRAQLSWASPHRTLFMFISGGGMAHSMSRRSMERLRRQGSIRVVSDGHLVDNAFDAVARTALQNDMDQLQQ